MAKNTSNKHDTIYIYIYIYISEINRYNRSKKIIQIKTTLMLLYIYSIQMNHCNPIYQCMSADNQIWLRVVIHCFDTDYGKWWTAPLSITILASIVLGLIEVQAQNEQLMVISGLL